MTGRNRVAAVAASLSLLLSATGCISNHHHVRYGENPKYADDDVRFQTTYYFRTFDWCQASGMLETKGKPLNVETSRRSKIIVMPRTDSLYRFRMTGKANSLFNKITFESGTLNEEQIDPFGSTVRYEPSIGAFRFVSQSDLDAAAKQHAALEEFDEILDRYRALKSESLLGGDISSDFKSAIVKALRLSLSTYVGRNLSAEDVSNRSDRDDPSNGDIEKGLLQRLSDLSSFKALEDEQAKKAVTDFVRDVGKKMDVAEATTAEIKQKLASIDEVLSGIKTGETIENLISRPTLSSTSHTSDLTCGNNPVQRGFQVMGPEGWRTYDQSERLVMAMSSSAKPLIGMLQEYSSRMLSAKKDSTSDLLVLTREQLSIANANRAVDQKESGKAGIEAMFVAISKEFGEAQSKEVGK